MSQKQADYKKSVEFSCSQCDYTCQTKKTFDIHRDSKHRGIFYYCKDCDYKAARKTYLTRHIAAVHFESRPWPCSLCSYGAATKSEINTHLKYVHNKDSLDKKRYQCEDCEYSSATSNNLRNHRNAKHMGIYYSCHLCDFKGSQKGHVSKHLESFHEQKKWPCDQCHYKATEKGSLRIHRNSVHMKIRYPCDQCDHKAAGKGLLRQHIETKHLGMMYPCTECDFVASSKPYLYLHTSKKHKKKGKECKKCGAEFNRRTGLKFHFCKDGIIPSHKLEDRGNGKRESKTMKPMAKGKKTLDEQKPKLEILHQSFVKPKEEGDRLSTENFDFPDFVKRNFKIPECIDIQFDPGIGNSKNVDKGYLHAAIGDQIEKVCKNTDKENGFNFDKENFAKKLKIEVSEASLEDFEQNDALEKSDGAELADYHFETIEPDMFGGKIEETELFNLELIEKAVVEREKQRRSEK